MTQYQAPFWDHPQIWLERPTAINLATTLLPDDNPQVPIHDYYMTTDETRNVGAAIVTLTKTIWAQARYLSPESRTDRSDPGSQMGEKKVHPHILDSHYAFTAKHVHRLRERGFFPVGKKDIKNKRKS